MTTMKSIDLRVGDVMSFNPVVVGPDEPVSEAERLIKTYRVSGLPVAEEGLAIGVISQTDLTVARSSQLISANWERMRVRHLMSRRRCACTSGPPPSVRRGSC